VKGVANQEIGRFTSTSSTSGTWIKFVLQFNKVLPSTPWTFQNIDTFINTVRIMGGAGNLIVSEFIPSACAGITNTLCNCEVVTNFVVPPGGSKRRCIFINIPLLSPMIFLL